MAAENVLETEVVVTEPADEASGFCTKCRCATHFMFDKELGYYKKCPKCGNVQYLHRRFLRFDRQSRQWL